MNWMETEKAGVDAMDQSLKTLARRMLTEWDKGNSAKSMIAKYGIEAQLGQVQEEAAELIVAISHYKRRRKGAIAELAEEAGDMAVMLEQVRVVLGGVTMDEAIVASWAKVARKLEER